MNFFEYIISPFIWFIEQVFLFSYNITGNYGLAIILLSFSVSLLLLPVFIYIEKSKKKDDVIKQKMQPLIDEIKRVYKGQERYYYLKTINRQHNYSSLKALIPILSLLIQIPFFIAAYQYLEHFEGLKGVSFLFIQDLGAPDGLFGVVNILPILMTIINLITVYYYTRLGDGSERKQMLVIAIAFLVLLFNLPAGLVMYWTMNNLFSFFRLFITNPEVFKKQEGDYGFSEFKFDFKVLLPRLKKVFVAVFVFLVLSQLAWAIKYYFDDFAFRLFAATIVSIALTLLIAVGIILYQRNKDRILNLEVKPTVFFSLLFLSVYFYLASKFYFTGVNEGLALLGILFVLPLQLIAYVYYRRNYIKNSYAVWVSLSLKLLVFFQFIHFLSLFSSSPFHITIWALNLGIEKGQHLGFIISGVLFSVLAGFSFFRNIQLAPIDKKQAWWIYSLSVFYLLSFVFLWNPLSVYSSFPDDFTFPAVDVLLHNFDLFLYSAIFLILAFLLIPRKYKSLWVLLSLSVLIISFVNNTLLPINVGSLQEGKYLIQSNLAQPIVKYLLEAGFIIFIFIGVYRLLSRKTKWYIIGILSLLNIVLISNSIFLAANSGKFFTVPNISSNLNHSIQLSKTKQNIVFIISDMFHGWNMKHFLEEDPELKNELSGFTWYPNTLSISAITGTSMPAIIGGYNYTVDKLNQHPDYTLYEKMTKVTEQFVNRVKANGFRFTATDMVYSKINKNKFDSYLPKWTKEWDKWNPNLKIGKSTEQAYKLLWKNAAFYSLPLILKPEIYHKGKWLDDVKNKNKNTSLAKRYNLLRLLPYISSAESNDPNFIYIHSMASHYPWSIINKDGELINDVKPYENNKWVLQTLIKWFQWMKDNGVYDNTKIILLSDHGVHWQHCEKKDIDKTIPIINEDKLNLKVDMTWIKGMYPLLLVKDFQKKGRLTEDSRFMSNADASYIAFNAKNPTNENYPSERQLPSSMTFWSRKLGDQKVIKMIYNIVADNSAFDLSKWEPIEQPIYLDNTPDTLFSTNHEEWQRERVIEQIKNNKKWYESVKKQAKERCLTIDSMLIRSANYFIKRQQQKQ